MSRRLLCIALLLGAGLTPAAGVLARTAPESTPALRIEVFKAKRQLQVYSGHALVETYRIGLGADPLSPKRREGDRATPEGRYFISHKNPRSQYFLSLGISYPGIEDAARGLRERRITKAQYAAIVTADRQRLPPPANTALGGNLFVHGRGSSTDWTWGCVALDDADMRKLYDAIEVGTPITIHP
ncbi:MAG TPA: L,D-transpeptidase family protein [Dokdonella sp.]